MPIIPSIHMGGALFWPQQMKLLYFRLLSISTMPETERRVPDQTMNQPSLEFNTHNRNLIYTTPPIAGPISPLSHRISEPRPL